MVSLNAARWPRGAPLEERLLHVDPSSATLRDARIADLPSLLVSGDIIVVNDAATLPASLRTRDLSLEVRLASRIDGDRRWRAVLFGAGDFRTPTEHRPEPRAPVVGEHLRFGEALGAHVTGVDPETPRLIELSFDRAGAELWSALYRYGRPVQYAHVAAPLELWHVQNQFSARPWSVELASAGRPLTSGLLAQLDRNGIRVAFLTHAAGLSSTGSVALDARLPFPERFAIPESTASMILEARRGDGRVVAVGTTVVRALEASAAEHDGVIEPGEGRATLRIGPGFRPRVTNGILTGMHERGTSHFALMAAFAPSALLERALEHAAGRGYLQHEFGDSCLVL